MLIARVTLWMGHRQMIEMYGEAEAPLPLVDLSGIRRADALREPWPETDCIIGNPPFLGDRNLRRAFGDTYVNWLERTFGVGLRTFASTGSVRLTTISVPISELGWSEQTPSGRTALVPHRSNTW